MKYTYFPKGVCSRAMVIEVDDGIIKDIKIIGGCDGNLSGISRLVKGQDPDRVIELLKGIDCNSKGTSCPDQLAKALIEIKSLGNS